MGNMGYRKETYQHIVGNDTAFMPCFCFLKNTIFTLTSTLLTGDK